MKITAPLYISLALHVAVCSLAQAPPDRSNQVGQNSNQDNSPAEEKDTFPIQFFFKDIPNQVFNHDDTLLGYQFMQYDPARRTGDEWVHLGNLGSAARPILFTPQRNTGLDLGLHSYDLYKKSFSRIRLYQLNTPITQLFFTQGRGQENSMIQGLLSRNFSKGLHANIDYQRINHLGIYRHQKNRNTALTATLWYQHPRQKWDLFLSYVYNKIEAEDNGGVLNVESLKSIGNNPATEGNRGVVDVFLDQAKTRNRENGVELKLNYYLDKIPLDTMSSIAKTQLIESSISYVSQDLISFDSSIDSIYYSNYFIDDRGLRRSMSLDQFSIDFSYAWRFNDSSYFRPFVKAGLRYDRNILTEDLHESTINNLHLFGEFNKKLWPGAEVQASMKSYFAANAGDLELSGKILQRIRKNLLIGSMSIQRFKPNRIEQQLLINNEDFWVNSFKNPSYLLWSGQWINEMHHWKIGFNNYLLNNWIYFDETKRPLQFDNTEVVLSFYVQKLFKFGKWRSYHYLLFQDASNASIPLPSLYVKNAIYLSTYIFKNAMLFQPGLDLRWNSNYQAPGYFPLTNQFYNQSNIEVGEYPLLDVFVNFKVSSFRAFVKMENITSYLTDEVYIQHAIYPYFDASFRLGINWQLRN